MFKATSVFATWAKDCDQFVFVAKLSDRKRKTPFFHEEFLIPIMEPSNLDTESYENLTSKVFNGLVDVYTEFHGFDWYLKADDDTFVFVENLRDFLSDKNSSSPVSFGFDILHAGKNPENTYHSGGAGYVLSREALKKFSSTLKANMSGCVNRGREDIDVSLCLRQIGVKQEKTIDTLGRQRFHQSTFQR
jgi:glycoprotein-N-acetylgalactosamine 3-beta-galactosyltransferase